MERGGSALIVIRMVRMSPVPICFLIVRAQFAKIAVGAVRFDGPLVVVTTFVIVPDMVIVIAWIVRSVGNTRGTAHADSASYAAGKQKYDR